MKKKTKWLVGLFITIGVLFTLGLTIYAGFNTWSNIKHDKDIFEYLQDKNDKNADEIVVENEDGSVEATAVIKF